MPGYCEYSKSNNAVEAEEDHRFPISRLCRLYGLKTKSVKDLVEPCEWHHTSKFYNEVDYYDARDCVRGRILPEITIERPSAIHKYNRMLLHLVMVKESIGYNGRFSVLRKRMAERLEELNAESELLLSKREAAKEAKKKAELAAAEAAEAKRIAKIRKTYAGMIKLRCESQGVTSAKIKRALTTKIEEGDRSSHNYQIQKWFSPLSELSLEQKAGLGIVKEN